MKLDKPPRIPMSAAEREDMFDMQAHRLSLLSLSDADPAASRQPPRILSDLGLLRAIDRVEQDNASAISVAALASEAALSPFHFIRKFTAELGESPAQYTRRVRLQFAAVLICRSHGDILDAALRVGYQSQAAFTRSFAAQFDITPARLRATALQAVPPVRTIHKDFARAAISQYNSARPLIAMRFHGSYTEVPSHWRIFAGQLQRAGFPLDRAKPVGVLNDDPGFTRADSIRYDCAIIDEDFPVHRIRAPLRRLQFNEGTYATVPVSGPYQLAAEAIYGVCAIWLAQNRYQFALTSAYEVYDSAPWEESVTPKLNVLVPLV